MRRSIRVSIRCLVIVALLAAVLPALAPNGQGGSPYLSPLSVLTVGSVYADPNPCNQKHCSHNGPGGPKCVDGGLTLDCHVEGGSCITVSCP
jgi:hypothetical protein